MTVIIISYWIVSNDLYLYLQIQWSLHNSNLYNSNVPLTRMNAFVPWRFLTLYLEFCSNVMQNLKDFLQFWVFIVLNLLISTCGAGLRMHNLNVWAYYFYHIKWRFCRFQCWNQYTPWVSNNCWHHSIIAKITRTQDEELKLDVNEKYVNDDVKRW